MNNPTRAAFLTALVMTAVLHGAISADGARVVKDVNASLDKVQKNPAYASGSFSGQEAEARAHLAAVTQAARDGNRELRFLVRDSREPEVRATQARIDDLLQYAESVKAALANSGQSSDQLKGLVYDFVKEHLSGGLVSTAAPLTLLQRDPTANVSIGGDNAANAAILNSLAAIDASCKSKYRQIANQKHPSNPELDPALWCATAANRQSLLAKSTESMAGRTFDGVISEYESLKNQLESKEGFLAIHSDKLSIIMVNRETLRNELRTRFKAQMDQAGITDVDKLLTRLDPVLNGLRSEIERLAPRWQFPAAGPHDPGAEALARAQVAREYKGIAARASAVRYATFRIHKNALGIPLYRYKDGHVLYKLPAESLCRQQAFTYTETFDGTGYQKPSGVRLNYVRYLRCQ